MATKIKEIKALEILDSRGFPAIEVSVVLDNGLIGLASVSSNEAFDKRDDDKARYLGQGVELAIKNIENYLAPALLGMSPLKQTEIDKKMISLDKEKMGLNVVAAISLAVARVAALSQKKSLHEYLNE